MNTKITVGVDGTDRALLAVDLAADEAARRRCALLVVHADPWPASTDPSGEGHRTATRWVDEAVCRVRAAQPQVAVSGEVVTAFPKSALLELSRESVLVVIGDRALNAVERLLLDTVAGCLALHAECPILVVRGETARETPIVVGVDGSTPSGAAIEFAFEEAALRRSPIEAVHAWSHPLSQAIGELFPPAVGPAPAEAEEARMLAEELAGWCEKYPDVRVHRRLVSGRPRRALLDASAAAGIVVVGARGRSTFDGPRLGSVSQALPHHSACPVVVVPSRAKPGSGR